MSIVGKRVIVVWSNSDYDSSIPFPSVGSMGTIVSEIDHDGDFDVEFDDQPCPVGPETSWCTHRSMVVLWGENQSATQGELHGQLH